MQCEHCEQKAISAQPRLCAAHYDEWFVQQVQNTIQQFNLFTKEDKICVAVSGGKDSLAVMDVLTRLGHFVEGLFINEGITGYREHSIEDLKNYSEQKDLSVVTVDFAKEAGFSLDQAMATKKVHACTICGTLRRQLLNKYSAKYNVIATGHNLDDEAQTILINIARGNTELFLRQGPSTKENSDFTRRVKPLYFLTEKQVLTYTILRNIKTQFGECPYASTSYRSHLRDALNKLEQEHPGTKRNVVDTYLNLQEKTRNETRNSEEVSLNECSKCGQPSQDEICKSCKLQDLVKKEL